MNDGFHDYSTNPTGPWPTTETDMENLRVHAIARLTQLGATDEQAAQFVDEVGGDVVRSESDGDLKARIAQLGEVIPDYDPGDFHVDEVLEYVGDDAVKAQAVLAAEGAGKARKTLVAALNELATPADGSGGDPGEDAGVAGSADESDPAAPAGE